VRVLVLNAGTGTAKVALTDATPARATVTARHVVEARSGQDVGDLFVEALDRLGNELDAVGHRIVHGGTRFTTPVRIDQAVAAGIEALVPLAPLHNPAALAGIRAARACVGAGLAAWGVAIDPALNAAGHSGTIGGAESRPVYVIPTDEETVIARAVAAVLEKPR
jgi:acetate kinase